MVLDAVAIPVIDTTAADMLRNLALELANLDVQLILVGDLGQVRDVLREAGVSTELDPAYPSIDDAIDTSRRRLGPTPFAGPRHRPPSHSDGMH